jgi:hypothetical protein
MAVNKVEIYVSQVLEDLNNGLTWLKKDDLGYGSIQEKYDARDQQIAIIRKHPALKNAETTVTVFTVIDDTKEDYNGGATTISATEQQNEQPLEEVLDVQKSFSVPTGLSEADDFTTATTGNGNAQIAEEELSAFANL